MQNMWREAARLRASLIIFADCWPWLVWAGVLALIVCFWVLAYVGAVTLWRGL